MSKITLLLVVSLVACSAPEAKPAGSADSPSATVPGSALSGSSAAPVGSAPNPTTRPHTGVVASDLVGSWQHAFEKNVDGLETYVAGGALPPARFRKTLELAAGGKARVLCLSPSDAHEMRDGSWQLASDVLTIEVQCFGPQRETFKYSVERAKPGELAMRPLP